jgi:hypothetical protein
MSESFTANDPIFYKSELYLNAPTVPVFLNIRVQEYIWAEQVFSPTLHLGCASNRVYQLPFTTSRATSVITERP